VQFAGLLAFDSGHKPLKIFWAWQADLPGKISRHFVRGALEEAIERLKQPKDIEEPPDEARRNDLHLDHDTKGLSGSPEVAREIFNKIESSSVFVADVTPVGRGLPRATSEQKLAEPKPLMNPNVAIELGFALHTLGDARLLMILNEAYGTTAGLPFDMQHRRHPITYRLAEGAGKADIETEKARLVAKLVEALESFIVTASTKTSMEAFPEAAPRIGQGLFFAEGEALGLHRMENQSFVMPFRSVAWLRVIPKTRRILAVELLRNSVGRFGAFGGPVGAFILENGYGVAMLEQAGATWNVDNLSQYFRTGEIWAINADILRQGQRGDGNWVLSFPLENLFITSLRLYFEFMEQVAKIAPPFKVEAGVEGIKGRKLAHTGIALGSAGHGTMYEDRVVHQAVLNKSDPATQLEFLMAFFERLNANTGNARPKGLYGR
jgi:hypothetical protein